MVVRGARAARPTRRPIPHPPSAPPAHHPTPPLVQVRGQHPHYEAPNPMHTKVDHVLDPNLSLRLGRVPKTNFLKRNMGQ